MATTTVEQGGWQRLGRFVRLFLAAGVAGGCFTAIVRGVSDKSSRFDHASWATDYSWLQYERYGYLLWLMFYFVVSQFRMESESKDQSNPWKRDLFFTVTQVSAALVATYRLNFGEVASTFSDREGFFAANVAILIICIVSLIFYAWEEGKLLHPRLDMLNALRLVGAFVAGWALYKLLPRDADFIAPGLIRPQLIIHWVLLALFCKTSVALSGQQVQKVEDTPRIAAPAVQPT